MRSKLSLIMLFLAAFSVSEVVAQAKLVREAKKNFERDDYQEAASIIKSAVIDGKSEKDSKAWKLMGDIYYKISKKDSADAPVAMKSLDTAIYAYKKVLDMDKAFQVTAFGLLNNFYVDYWTYGANSFNDKDYETSYDAFKNALKMKEFMDDFNAKLGGDKDKDSEKPAIDTMTILNIGNAAFNKGDKKEAVKYYQKLADIKYKESSFIYKILLQEYKDEDDADKYLSTLELAKQLFPEDQDFVNDEINYYREKGETDKLVEKLKEAVEEDPENYYATFGLAVSLDNMAYPKDANGDDAERPDNYQELFDEAIKNYKKAAELKPDDYAANFNLGLMYYNAAAYYGKELGNLESGEGAKQDSLVTIQDDYLDQAEPYLEETYEKLDAEPSLEPNDLVAYKNTLMGLQGIYARKNENDKYEAIKKKLDEADQKAK